MENEVVPPPGVRLGPLTRTIGNEAVWWAEDEFPAFQSWADQIERVLALLLAQGMFERFLPRLRSRERDGALAEAWVAFFFRNGFKLVRWDPIGVPGRPGDLEIQWRESPPIFVEVKGPTWRAELDEVEIARGRRRQPQYIHAEARAIDPARRVIAAIGEALPKFSRDTHNLLVLADNLFVSPAEHPPPDLEARVLAHLRRRRSLQLAGVLLFKPVVYSVDVVYRTRFIASPNPVLPLPDPVLEGLQNSNRLRQGPR